jgi:hypothetical protein
MRVFHRRKFVMFLTRIRRVFLCKPFFIHKVFYGLKIPKDQVDKKGVLEPSTNPDMNSSHFSPKVLEQVLLPS